MADLPPPAPTKEEGDNKAAAPFQFNFGAPPAPAANVTNLMQNIKLADGAVVDSDSDDDGDEAPELVVDEDDGVISLTPQELIRVTKLKQIQTQRGELLEQYEAERKALEKKYSALYAPLYEQRAKVVNGEVDVQPSEVGLDAEQLGELATEPEGSPKGISKFWLLAMNNLEPLQEIIEESDAEPLSFLKDVRCIDNDALTGFNLEFHFAENPYFTNEVLVKKYEVSNLLKDDQEPCLEGVSGTEINWKAGKCLTHTTKKKKQRAKKGKNAGQVRYVTEKVPTPSFFRWFTAPDMDKLKKFQKRAAEGDATVVEDYEETMDEFHADYSIASNIRLLLIPNAVLCFTGEIVEDDSDDEDGADVESDDEDDSDDE